MLLLLEPEQGLRGVQKPELEFGRRFVAARDETALLSCVRRRVPNASTTFVHLLFVGVNFSWLLNIILRSKTEEILCQPIEYLTR